MRRLIGKFSLACALLATSLAWAQSPPHAKDLAREAAALEAYQSLLIFFTLKGCPYCENARKQYLGPMSTESHWSGRTRIREVAIESNLRDFSGTTVSGRDLASRYGIRMYPTVIVVGRDGRPLVDALVGFGVPDFYGASLADRIDIATNRLRAP
ncbi:MAG: hypothetical protein ACKVQQ_20820 [Burkholderiales bacterium]